MRGKPVPRTPSRFLMEIPTELYEEREESTPIAPQMDKVKAGAAGVLAAILGEGNGTGEIDLLKRPFVPRPRGR
jgi:DNA helicase-2/ATP-dependent DNA helicase PcrA